MPAKGKRKGTKKDEATEKKAKADAPEVPEQDDSDLKQKIVENGGDFKEEFKIAFNPKKPAKAPKGLTFPLHLDYFPLRALSEVSKLVLEAAQVPYVFTGDEKTKEVSPFGSIPVLRAQPFEQYHGLAQSGAIVRYLGGKFGLDLKSAEERAIVDMLFEQSKDFSLEHIHSSNKESDAYKKFIRHLQKVEALLPADKDTFFEKLTYADLAIFHVLQSIQEARPGALVDELKVPRLEKFRHHVANLPNIAAYLKSARRLPATFKELRIPGWEKQPLGGYAWYISPEAKAAAEAAKAAKVVAAAAAAVTHHAAAEPAKEEA